MIAERFQRRTEFGRPRSMPRFDLHAPPIRAGLEFFGDLSSPNTSIVSGAVAQLGDSSGNGRHFTQATSTRRPAYTASDSDFGGRPSMTFDGVDDLIASAAYGGWTGRTVYVVFRQTATSADARLYTDQVGALAPTAYLFTTAGPAINGAYVNPVGAFTNKNAAIANNASIRLAAAFVPTNGADAVPRMYLNGVASGSYSSTTSINGASFASGTHAIGAAANGAGAFYAGKIADILDYSVTHSADEMALVDEWLRWRNGL